MLRTLMRKANAEYLDRGLSVLYVAFGMLHWKEVDGTDMTSPLLLMPVTLIPEGPKGTPRLTSGEDDSVLNPALALRLKEFNIELPRMDALDDLSVSATLAAVRAALESNKDFKDWDLRSVVYLSTFSFAKEAMFRDLLDNEDRILDHPVVQALATSDPTQQASDFQFDLVDPADIDRVAPPELTPLVLDADSSQRAAIAAALAGHSFVMDGPPGTGKSQTIANMIGALLHAGKTVLFVSEKMAALDVVRNRLSDAGLANYLLELHSHKASRKEVATELLRSLDNVAQAPKGMDSISRASVKDRREKLNAYADAMNRVQQPLNLSLHHVLGRLSVLADVPSAPIPETPPTDLTQEDYARVHEATARLVRAWRPAAQGSSFLWRDVRDESSLDIRLYQARTALEQLQGTVNLNADLVSAFDLEKPSDVPQLLSLLDHQHRDHPGEVPESWVTTADWHATIDARQMLGEQIAAVRGAEAVVLDRAGVPWTALPGDAAIPPTPGAVAATAPVELAGLTADELYVAAERFEHTAQELVDRSAGLSGLARSFGLPEVVTFAQADRVHRLVELRDKDVHPQRNWLTAAGLAEAREAARALQQQEAMLTAAEAKASTVFTAAALAAPLAELRERFTNLHKGLKKLSGDYRADKRTVAGLLNSATNLKEGIKHLSDAVAWGEATQAFDMLAASRSELLGTHWNGRETDYDSLATALTVADEVIALTGDAVPHELAGFLAGHDTNEAQRAIADSARLALDAWKSSLAPAPQLAGRPELLLEPISASVAWLSAHIGPMRQAAARIATVSAVTGRAHTLHEVDAILELSEATRRTHEVIRDSEQRYRDTLGAYFAFAETDLAGLDTAMAWAALLREMIGGPLSSGQVKALADSHLIDNLSPAYERWVERRQQITNAFGVARQPELHREFDDYTMAVELIEEFRDDTVGQLEWFEYQVAREELAARGLDTAIDFCIEHHVPADEVPKVVDRALLRAWAEAVIHNDSDLRPVRADDRTALVEEYRKLDRALITGATSEIIRVANSRRPANTGIGEPAIIRREGTKQKRHIPVRDLVARARTTAMSIKPVFMMSPLAVSQYLPPDISFDVVIFDEASQVTPGDAINCIYRGRAFILAGDDKQLPPTSFFERSTDDDHGDDETDVKDFQSVLELAKACGSFNNLGLRWHYRSRHESLIAFSNYKFYESKLVTYPSSQLEGADVGVEFFNAHGMYRRGGGADNPAEARKVAERVIEHFANRPELTLGVVTFSVAQADAVQAAIDEMREAHRELDRFFDSGDRLDGFFVRSLESVQGDERDVIIFSIGYGPDEAGKITTNFGVLNKDKGWRRLNVGITRARQRVEVVASMRAGDIPPSPNENVEFLRAYLDYADRGTSTLAVPYSSTGLEPESPFEESVIAAIRSWGYTVEPQVGAAGFRIDIGVRHPVHPGMFAIGVECDGFQYHSAPAARDRDRLRDQILGGLGWTLHRIWGTAWYRNRTQEETRLRNAIEAAVAAPVTGRIRRVAEIERPIVETTEVQVPSTPTWTSDYIVARPVRLPYWVEPGEPGNDLHMMDALVALADVEGPVHLDLVYERIRGWWNIGRVSYKVRDNVDRAIRHSPILRDGDFIDMPDRAVDRVRVPAGPVSRKVEHVHLDELALSVQLLLNDVGAALRSEVIQQIARLFGWARTGAIVDRRINEAIDLAVRGDSVTEDGARLVVSEG
ncbi:AAA domain-containing protein [Jiangella sp. DSM 45060]|nr:AAA domain-containing protein [Jiangella sp. DSM 45060]